MTMAKSMRVRRPVKQEAPAFRQGSCHTTGEHKGRSVHVVAMETRIGRHILPDEVVHHIDGNRRNNEINNLALMTRAAHTRLHRREESFFRKVG